MTMRICNWTRVERDASGSPVAIVAPFGKRTELSGDTDGLLKSIADPAGLFGPFGVGAAVSLNDNQTDTIPVFGR
jgi:YD repeat-containing protein